MLYKIDEITNNLKQESWLPEPAGSWEVGYVDIMTQGLPQQSQYLRLYYPTKQKHRNLPDRCHIWSEPTTKHGFINFIKAQVHNWPSWANYSEFKLLDFARTIEKFMAWSFRPVFSLGWNWMCNNPKIPVIHQAQPATPPSGKWPLVIFSHGMGCNRYAYSKICYDLCSEGYLVASVEHREGSACHSKFFKDGKMEEIEHLELRKDENEYEIRNRQAQQRRQEVNDCLELLKRLNAGFQPENVLQSELDYDLSDFTGRMDFSELYLMGHSFGGCTALFEASRDDSYKGIICIDPWMFPVSKENFSVHRPVLMINTEKFANDKNIKKVREACSDVNAKVLEGAVHLVHTDAPLLIDNDLYKSGLGMLCSRDTEQVLQENHSLVSSWISSMVKGDEIEKTQDWGVVQ